MQEAVKQRIRLVTRSSLSLIPQQLDLSTRAWAMARSELIAARLKRCGEAPSFGKHCTWVHAERMTFGNSVAIGPYSRLSAVTQYMDGHFEPSIAIGDRVSIGWYAHITSALQIEIGDDTLIGSHFFVTDHNHGSVELQDFDVVPVNRALMRSRVSIGARCWIGERVIVLPGASIGDGCTIGAGSVVTGAIRPGATAVGVPAREIGSRSED